MISAIDFKDVPNIQQSAARRRPEGAFAKRQMQEFLNSGLNTAEVTNIPAAYNTTRLCEALRNAAWSLCDRPREVGVMKRGARVFLIRYDGPRQRRR